jgi:hypothetical protein
MNKICTVCKNEKEETQFNFRDKKNNKRYLHCKECQKKFRHDSYFKNRDYYLEKDKIPTKTRRQERREFINNFKKNKPCHDCCKIYPHYIMDFDHLPKFKKEIKIGARGKNHSEERLLEEFNKCELVCANCHRERTWQRRNNKLADAQGLQP